MDPVVASACNTMYVISDECSNDVEVLRSGADRDRDTSGVARAGGDKAASATEEMSFSAANSATAACARLSQLHCCLDGVFYALRKIGVAVPVCRETAELFQELRAL